MIPFEKGELLLSALFAVIYGAGFSVLLCGVDIILAGLSVMPRFFGETVRFDNILPPPRFAKDSFRWRRGPIYIFLAFTLFALGFSLLSYVSLDGQTRIYMLILAFASFYLSKIAFFDFLRKAFLWLFGLALSAASVMVRLAILPIKLIVRFVKKAQRNAQIF